MHFNLSRGQVLDLVSISFPLANRWKTCELILSNETITKDERVMQCGVTSFLRHVATAGEAIGRVTEH